MLPTAYFCAKFVGHLNQIFIDLYVMKVWLGFTIPYMTQGKRSGSAKRLTKELSDESRNKKLIAL